jgi:hypothetical protein
MNKKLASLLIRISANGAEAQAVFKGIEKSLGDIGKKAETFGKNMSKYVTVPLTALAAVSVKLANTQQQAEAKLLTALQGREAVQQRLIKQAGELQSRTTFGDEAIIEQQAFLAALGLTEAQIVDTINAAVQLSAALGISLESAVKNLAKTFGGMTGELGESIPALKSLTKEQLMAGEAISFVNENYKGFAETAASTGTGALEQLKNQLGDLGEQIGIIILPAIEKLVKMAKELVGWLQELSPATKTWVVELGALAAVLGPLAITFGKILGFLSKIKGALPAILAGVQSITPFLAGLGSRLSPEEWMSEETYAAYQKAAGVSSVTDAVKLIKERYIPVVEEATEANEKLAESIVTVVSASPKPKITPVSGISSGSANLSGLTAGVALDTDALSEQIASTSQMVALFDSLSNVLAVARAKAERIKEISTLLGNTLRDALTNLGVMIAEGIGKLMAGARFTSFWEFIKMLADMITQLGSALVAFATAQIAVQTALKSGNWVAALVGGIAAIAAGTALSITADKKLQVPALASGGLAYSPTLAVVGDNRGAASDPEVIAPLSKLRQYMGQPSLELVGDVEFRVDGDALRAVLNRANTRLKYR